MTRTAKISIATAAVAVFAGASWAAAEMLLSDPERRNMRRLRRELRTATARTPYKVTVIHRQQTAPWPAYYTFASIIDGRRLEIGPVAQYSAQEALKIAREQYRRSRGLETEGTTLSTTGNVKRPRDGSSLFNTEPCGHCIEWALSTITGIDDPGKETAQCPECGRIPGASNPAVTHPSGAEEHVPSVRLEGQGNYRLQCSCGWLSEATAPNHLCRPNECPACADIHREFEQHAGTAGTAGTKGAQNG